MSTIVAFFESAIDTPLAAPANTPTIRIRRTDTQALVVTDLVMTEQGEGNFSFEFEPDPLLEYSIRSDGDPTASGQTIAGSRYAYGSISGVTDRADFSSLYDMGSGPGIHWSPAGTSGSVLGVNGTATNPVDNETDLFSLAAALDTRRIYVGPGTLVLAASHTGFFWYGCGSRSVVNPSGNDVGDGCFVNVILNGAFGGVLDCELTNGSLFSVTGWQGTARNSRLFDSVSIRPGGYAEFVDCFATGSLTPGTPCEIICGGVSATIGLFAGVEGDLILSDLQSAGSEFLISHNSGQITLDATTTAANVLRISGNYSLTNNGTITPDVVGATGEIVDAVLTTSHGAGSWSTATGFAVAGDAMTLTAGERTAIDGVLAAAHGAGAWDGTATAAVVQAGLTAQGYTIARAPLLDNLDVAVSTRSTLTQADILNDATPFAGADIDAAISTRSSHSAADVDTLITASHGAGNYTTATGFAVAGDAMTLTAGERTAIDGVLSASHGGGLWDGTTSIADIQAGLDANGYTIARSTLLDNLDAAISGIDAVLTASHGAGSWSVGASLSGAVDEIHAALGLTLGSPASFDSTTGITVPTESIDVVLSVVGSTVTLTRQP